MKEIKQHTPREKRGRKSIITKAKSSGMQNNEAIQQDLTKLNKLKLADSKHSTEFKARLKMVMADLLCGYAPFQIIDAYHREWECSESSMRRVITIAKNIIREQFQQDPDDIKNDIMQKYNFLYQMACEKGDVKQAVLILDSIAKFTQGLKITISKEVEIIELEPFTYEDAEIVEDDTEEEHSKV